MSAGGDQPGGRRENLPLALPAKVDVFFFPFRSRLRIFPEHPFAGAGRIAKYQIKDRAVKVGQCRGEKMSNDRVREAHPLQISLKHTATPKVNL